MFYTLLYLLLSALHISRIAAEVPASCQQDRDGFLVTEDTYANKIVAFQVASAPASLNITNHYLTLDNPTNYLTIRNITVHPDIFYASRFLPVYSPPSQSPKSGLWTCAWHKFVDQYTANYNYTTGGSPTDLVLVKLNWDPSPLLFTSYETLKRDFREEWSSMSYAWLVSRNGEGDTRVMGSQGWQGMGKFFAYMGSNGKTLVGHADKAELDGVLKQPIELRMVIVGEKKF